MRSTGLRQFALVCGVAAIAVIASLSSSAVSAQTMGEPERFTAVAMNMNQGSAGNVEIAVERWSTDAERDKFMTADEALAYGLIDRIISKSEQRK